MIFIALFLMLGVGLCIVKPLQHRLSRQELFVISVSIGIVVWSLLVYATAWANIRWVSLAGVIVIACLGWWQSRRIFISLPIRFTWAHLLIVVGVLAQLYLVAPSGIHYGDNLVFFGVNAHDGVWHVALIETLKKPFPPQMPTFAGATLKGYHYLIDLFGSELSRVFSLSSLDLTFRWLPGLFSLVMGLGILSILERLTKSKAARLMGVFLTYFGGSFGFIFGFFGRPSGWESAFWSQQSITTLINLPLAASFALMTAVFLLVMDYIFNKKMYSLIIASIIVGASISVKAYGGLLLLGGFLFFILLTFLKQRALLLFAPISICIGLTLLLVVAQLDFSQSTFLWEPGWFVKTMMEASDRVNFPRWELLRQMYVADAKWLHVTALWIIAILMFIVGNLGVRVTGILALFTPANKVITFYLFLLSMVIVGIGMPLLLLQRGIVWNAIQFIYYSLFIMNIFTALAIARFKKQMFVILLFAIFSIPTSIKTLIEYSQMYQADNSGYRLTLEQQKAFSYLRNVEEGIVLAPYQDQAYISALSGKQVLFQDQTQADLLNLNSKPKQRIVHEVFCKGLPDIALKGILDENNIEYIYTDSSLGCNEVDFGSYDFLDEVFSTSTNTIYTYKD